MKKKENSVPLEINLSDTKEYKKDKNELNYYKISDSTLLQKIQILYLAEQTVTYGKTEFYPATDSAKSQFTLPYTADNMESYN